MTSIDSKLSIIDYVKTKYPTDHPKIMNLLENYNRISLIKTTKEFVEAYVLCLLKLDPQINVSKSSSWGVCQEYLKNLTGEELRYIKTRSGIWSCKSVNFINTKGVTDYTVKIICMRDILADLETLYG